MKVGQRVFHGEAAATIVHRYADGLFVDIDYDEAQPCTFADGTPTTRWCVCIHIGLLRPVDGLF